MTELHWFPALPGKAQTTAEVFVVGGTDGNLLNRDKGREGRQISCFQTPYPNSIPQGKFYICTRAGRVEKGVEAHKGAILAVKWNYEGSALLTAGEDGQVKIWSRAGMLRSSLIQMGYPIYSACWSPENDKVLITNGRNLVIKPIQAGTKPNQVKRF